MRLAPLLNMIADKVGNSEFGVSSGIDSLAVVKYKLQFNFQAMLIEFLLLRRNSKGDIIDVCKQGIKYYLKDFMIHCYTFCYILCK